MERAITGYHRDEEGDWVAELSCGHGQHVRHRPPFQLRAWVLEADGRRERLGTPLDCPLCDRAEPTDGEAGGGCRHTTIQPEPDQGGDPACWAHLLCPECGTVLDGEDDAPADAVAIGHRLPADSDGKW